MFSVTIVWPKSSLMRCAWMRTLTSSPPPAANGTISVIGRVGHSCALAMAVMPRRVARTAGNFVLIMVSLRCWARALQQARVRSIIAALDLRERSRNLLAHVVEAAADHVLHRRRSATIGDVRDLGAHDGIQEDRAHMPARAAAGGAVLQLRLIRLRVGHELGQRIRGE